MIDSTLGAGTCGEDSGERRSDSVPLHSCGTAATSLENRPSSSALLSARIAEITAGVSDREIWAVLGFADWWGNVLRAHFPYSACSKAYLQEIHT
jgi:hypothetical protein